MANEPDALEGFATTTLSSWPAIRGHQHDGWIYRGHTRACWQLETTLDRCCDRHKVPSGDRARVERELLREFRRAYHQYAAHVPPRDGVLEWLALMQHYGAPTRLLDFTYSIYIAAYFAVEKARQDCAVWAFNTDWALEEASARLRALGKPEELISELQKPNTESTEQAVSSLLVDSPSAHAAWPVNPFRLNDRLRIQKGVFLAPGAVDVTFMQNLASMPGHHDPANLIRIVIPVTLVSEVLADLFLMNITRRSLFPGLDGYAQELGVYHPVFNPNDPLAKAEREHS